MKFRIDFGRVFPGLLLLISGLLLIVVLMLVALVAFLFSFLAGSEEALGIALELMLVPVVLIAAGVIAILTGVSWRGKGGAGRFSGIARARAARDRIRLSGRVGEIVGIVFSVIVFLFLYENQLRGVAFFASTFGSTAQFFFYAPLFIGMALSLARALHGRRNAIKPFDALNALFVAVAAFWLLSVFPFDFTRFGDMFPVSIQVLFGWITNGVGRALFTLAGIASVLKFFYTVILYLAVRGKLLIIKGETPRQS